MFNRRFVSTKLPRETRARLLSARNVPSRIFGSLFLFPGFIPLFGVSGERLDRASVTELFLWVLAFAAFVFLGVVILLRLRNEAKLARSNTGNQENQAELFRDLYKKKLITAEEYKTIQKRFRDRLVEEVMSRPVKAPRKQGRGSYQSEPVDTDIRLAELLRDIRAAEKIRR